MKLFGSKKALMQERVRQKAAGHWIIHPCSSFRLDYHVFFKKNKDFKKKIQQKWSLKKMFFFSLKKKRHTLYLIYNLTNLKNSSKNIIIVFILSCMALVRIIYVNL